MYIEHYFLIIFEIMIIDIKARVFLSTCINFYGVFIALYFEKLCKTEFYIQKINCVNPPQIDIHATTQNVQLQYTRNTPRKPTPNRYIRN